MESIFSRTELLLGKEAVNRLSRAKVAVFGVGGVGGYVAEALARSGIGCLELIDKDQVSLSNINRQIIALHSTIGRFKAEVMRDRIKDINPDAEVYVHNCSSEYSTFSFLIPRFFNSRRITLASGHTLVLYISATLKSSG